jgi:DNA-binding transcriptional MerR regulator
MYTVSCLGNLFRLSRSTLLYYDRIGLLRPSARSASGYRLYSEENEARLRQIVLFRDIGVPLQKIKEYLNTPQSGVLPLLLKRLFAINNQITDLREQQNIILGMLEIEGSLKGGKLNLLAFKKLGARLGINEGNYQEIHKVFESASPETHKKLLKFLGFTDKEIREFIKKVREKS